MRLLALVEYWQIRSQTPEILSLFSVDASPGDASGPNNFSGLRVSGSMIIVVGNGSSNSDIEGGYVKTRKLIAEVGGLVAP